LNRPAVFASIRAGLISNERAWGIERIDQLIAVSRALRVVAAEARAAAQEARWWAEQAKQRARLAKLACQEVQQRPHRTGRRGRQGGPLSMERGAGRYGVEKEGRPGG
jgi:hypothetical protein